MNHSLASEYGTWRDWIVNRLPSTDHHHKGNSRDMFHTVQKFPSKCVVCLVSALLDSGASVSAISEEFFVTIKNQSPTPKLLSILPVTGVTISTALRGWSKEIKVQVFMPLVLFEKDATGVFHVVPHLSTSIILGDDWLSKYGVVLDYSGHCIKVPQRGKEYSFKGDEGDAPDAQITRLNVHYTTEHVVPTGLEHCLSSMDSLDRFSSPPRNLEINCINNHVFPRDPLSNRLNELMASGAEITVLPTALQESRS